MLDPKFIRENVELIQDNCKKKFKDPHIVTQFLEADKAYRELLVQEQDLRSQRNKLSKQVNEQKKKGEDITSLLEQVKEIPTKIKELDEKLQSQKDLMLQVQRSIPNIMHESVPIGETEAQNVELKKIGEPVQKEVLAHQEIAEKLGLADFTSSARTSGTGFYYLQGDLALLNQALLQYAIKKMCQHGFTYVETPLLLRDSIISNVVDLNDRENQIYKIENEDLYLIGTSEHSLIGRYLNQQLQTPQLPITQTSYSMCFRREKGSHGLDERGFFRTHQFNKVEMIVICKPEESMDFYQKLQDITVEIFTDLGLPIRVLQICSGDLGDLKHAQVDIEAWSPRRNEYIEVGSCSNLTDAQSRMLGIRVQDPKGNYFPHTLNNTAMATSRALVAILENCQENGKIKVPTCLVPYIGKEYLE